MNSLTEISDKAMVDLLFDILNKSINSANDDVISFCKEHLFYKWIILKGERWSTMTPAESYVFEYFNTL